MAKPTPKSDLANPNKVNVAARPDETKAQAMARNALHPTVSGGIAIKAFGRKYGDDLELGALVGELSVQAKRATQGDLKRAEAMLMVQAHTLDAIFNELGQRAAMNMGEYLGATETYLRLALKAQSQCRATLETLAAIKNPQPVAFVRQANIAAGPQQVNNGIPAEQYAPARAHAGKSETTPSRLSEGSNELRQDTGAPALAVGGDPQVEALGKIDRSEDAGRQGEGVAEQVQGRDAANAARAGASATGTT